METGKYKIRRLQVNSEMDDDCNLKPGIGRLIEEEREETLHKLAHDAGVHFDRDLVASIIEVVEGRTLLAALHRVRKTKLQGKHVLPEAQRKSLRKAANHLAAN